MTTPETLQSLRVALVHHWLVRMRGGEKVLESLCRILPQADIFTLVADSDQLSETLCRHRITTSWIQNLPWAKQLYTEYLPFFPLAIEQFDLSNYDLVISSEASVAKGVLTRPETCHICYCHSPMRYAWSAYHAYRQSTRSWKRRLMPLVMNYLRTWDVAAAQRVDYFLANSHNVAQRIRKYYRREATVIYPPIELADFWNSNQAEDYFLAAGHLVPYKRFDLAVEAFNQLGFPLRVIGEGPELSRLKKWARSNITFLGRVEDRQFRCQLSRCRALVFPGEEDFGMIVVEAHACGRPVIALARGGALETVITGVNGILFANESSQALKDAVRAFEATEPNFDAAVIRQTAQAFASERFREEMVRFLTGKFEEHQLQLANRREGSLWRARGSVENPP